MILTPIQSLWLTQLIQMTAAIALVSAATLLLCRSRPRLAYALWMVVLIKCLLPPIWSSPTSLFGWFHGQHEEIAAAPQNHFDRALPMPALPAETSTALAETAPAAFSNVTSKPRPELSLGAIVVVCLALGTVVVLGVAALASLGIRRRILEARIETPSSVKAIFDQLADSLRVRRDRVALIISARNIGPALVGWARPLVVIPQALAADETRLRSIFTHELLHYRRRDHWVAAVQILVTAAWWFHPLIWWMNRQIGRAREMSCDEQAIATLGCEPRDYGQMLIDVLRLERRPLLQNVALGLGSASVASQRLEHIVNHSNRFEKRIAWTGYLWITLLGLLLLPGARWVRGQTEPTPKGEGRTFTGQVLDKITNKPIAGAIVTLSRENAREVEQWDLISKQDLTTDADGHFSFTISPEEMADKHFCIGTQVQHPKYASLLWEGEGLSLVLDDIKKGEEPWFTHLKMAPGEEVSGTIVDPQGKPLAGCAVYYHSIVGDEQTAGLKLGSDVAMGDVKTDANGRFSFSVIKDTHLDSLSASTNEYAVLSKSFGAKRGDLGTFQLIAGKRITGTVMDGDGKPVAGLRVTADSEKRILIDHATERQTTTDAAGKFALAPVEAGKYQVTVQDDRFLPVNIEVAADAAPAPVDFRSPPLNTIRVHFVDSSGKPSQKRDRVMVSAYKGGVWFHTGFKGGGADAELHVPKGMENTQLNMIIGASPETTEVWRIGNVGDWRRGDAMFLGMLQEPVTDITVMQYKSPHLIVHAVDADGKPVANFKPSARYTDSSLSMPAGHGWGDAINGDVGFEPTHDKTGWQSSEMLIPGREFTVWASRDWYGMSDPISLNEGETREITIHLKPVPK